MTTVHRVPVELLTDEAFRPFGELLAVADEGPFDFEGTGIRGIVRDFRSAAGAQLMVLRSPYQGLRLSVLERHFNVTQAAIPLGGSSSVVAMAPPTGLDGPNSIPAPDQIRAFLLDGSKGFVLREGAWHTNRYPLTPPGSDFVLVTDPETTRELVRVPRSDWTLTQEVDYEKAFGVVFELVPP